jgi:fermentation-respiration switch protein FrsA (DUF1100 family)
MVSWLWTLLKSLLIVAVLGYLAIVAAMYFWQRSLLFPGATGEWMPNDAPWGEWVRIDTPDGERLAALYLPSKLRTPTLLLLPGNGDNIIHYGFLADAVAAEGLGLMALSYRGYPGSSGSPSETGLLLDGLAALDWLAARNAGPIVLLGRSLGSGVAVNTALERKVAAFVLVSPYDSISAVAQRHYPYLPVKWLIKDSFRSDVRMARVDTPKLFLHGDLDSVIPLSSGEKLFALATEPKMFSIQHGHGHNDIWSTALVENIIAFAGTLPSGVSPD